MTDIEFINRWLLDQEKTLDNRPIYQLVWSESQFEWRKGTFNDFSEGGLIYLRTVTETRLVRKYEYIHERWILERWGSPLISSNPELPLSFSEGSYEPRWVFEWPDGSYQKPMLKAVQFIVEFDRRASIMSPEGRRALFEEREERELQELEDMIDTNPMLSSIHMGESNVSKVRSKHA